MKDLTNSFGELYQPVKALLIMQKGGYQNQNEYYVESYDMDQGIPINGHPLSVKESNALAKALQVNEKKEQGFLNPKGLMPKNVLYLNGTTKGYAVWHTPAQRVELFFTESLGIPSGEANIPALVWKAGRNGLLVFALNEDVSITEDTPLCHAPFFNVYAEGRVCMGNVQLRIPATCGLEEFMALWQDYFFNSYFSHLFGGHNPVKGNIVRLWHKLVGSRKPFPNDVLLTSKFQVKNLLL